MMEKNHICKKCGGIAGWDSYFQSWICTRCCDVERKPVTNYDSLISKTPEELAEWLWFKVGKCPPFDVCPSQCIPCEAKDCWLDWLKQEVKENE